MLKHLPDEIMHHAHRLPSSVNKCYHSQEPHRRLGQCSGHACWPSSQAQIPESALHSGSLVYHTILPKEKCNQKLICKRPDQQCTLRHYPVCRPWPCRAHRSQRRRSPCRHNTFLPREIMRSVLHPCRTISNSHHPHGWHIHYWNAAHSPNPA